jgi:polyhydroxyalkanoate synthase subunit PhaC
LPAVPEAGSQVTEFQTETPPERPRQGPRPRPLHLLAAMTSLLSSFAALPIARRGSPGWSPGPLASALAGTPLASALAAAAPEKLNAALANEIRRRFAAVLAGIRRYQAHPYRRRLPPARPIYASGSTRIYEYAGAAPGVPTLFVPSLVNRGYILDLSERRSLLRYLARHGVRPWLIEWGDPGPAESSFDLADYVVRRLGPALAYAVRQAGGPVPLVGYCMGGNLALAAATLWPRHVSRLGLLATPWDFADDGSGASRFIAGNAPLVTACAAAAGHLPVDVLQAFFLAIDPALTIRKFADFAALDPASPAAQDFVALEDWVNDGVPLAAKVAVDCFTGWYGENRTARGAWRIGGQAVEPRRLTMPTFVALPKEDRIVPPASARALADALPDPLVIAPNAGHIGMVVGSQAEAGLWRPLAQWLRLG